jgi:DNA segregation ATPase FtsK/SpoIIIE, S-DNA-T family
VTTVLYRRATRRPTPEMPSGELSLQEPPALPEAPTGNLGMILTYLPMAIGSSATILIFVTPGSNSLTFLAAGLMTLTSLTMLIGQLGRTTSDRKRRTKGERRDYLRYLSQTRRKVRAMTVQQRESLAWVHPDPHALWSVAMTGRLWERRPVHKDFGEVRVGTGAQRLAVTISPLQTKPVEDLEPLCARALRRFIKAYTTVADQPVALYLAGFAQVTLRGDVEAARALVRALLGQLVTFHSPDEVRVVAAVAGERAGSWEWLKWLPHSLHPTDQDAAGPVRLIADSLDGVLGLLGEPFGERTRYEAGSAPSRDEPLVLILADGVDLPPDARATTAGYRNAVLLDVAGALDWKHSRTVLRLDVAADTLEMVQADRTGKPTRTALGRPDRLGPAKAAALARLIAPYRPGVSAEMSEPLAADFDLTRLLGIADVAAFDPVAFWAGRNPVDRLRVPIGVAEDGSPVELDIKESALGGNGPHGVLIGATGSGKSELLRTLVLALAATHSSEVLNFVLTDFKGGATFLGLDRLPHTSAVITNLADEVPLVARMQDALNGELVRRQELLRRAGNYSSVHDYEKARAGGAPLAPLPTLFVIVDEFSELLAAHREFIDLFVMIGRLGRSLGVHLLLASQRLDGGRIHQLESHLSYRIGLRTFSAMESRSVIGVVDAYELPPSPGSGFLRIDVSALIRFKAAYVSGPYRVQTRRQRQEAVRRQVAAYTAGHQAQRLDAPGSAPGPASGPEPGLEPAAAERRLLDVLVDRLAGQGPPAHQVWLPPLGQPPTLDELLPALAPDPERGLTPASGWALGSLSVPVGVVDRPYEQTRELLVADLAGAGGHVGIGGGPQSGKSTLLRSLICSLALTHTPREVQFYCLDFGGGTLAGLAGLPHVGGLANRMDTDRVTRTVAEITGILHARERRFAEHGIDGMASYRRFRREGRFADDPHGDVFLVVDGWQTMRAEFEQLEGQLRQLSNRMLGFGVHLVVTANRWSEIHAALRDQLGTRLELRLGDAVESVIDIRAANHVPALPGRGLTSNKLHFLAAVPRLDGRPGAEDLTDGVANLVEAVGDYWDGPAAPPVRMLPAVLDTAALPPPDGDLRVPLGLDEAQLAPVWHDFGALPHLAVLGDTESGKTNLLRLVIRAVTGRYGPDEARIMLVDLRRELYESVPEAYRLGYAVSAAAARQIIGEAATAMAARVPDETVGPEQLRRRDWWSGPRLFLVVDDYDLLSSGHGDHPFQPLLELLPGGADIGLHVVVARGAAGNSRTSMDPLMRRLQEANAPDLVLSCPPQEVPLHSGVRPRLLPPGRGMLVTRRGACVLQTAFLGDPE